MSKHYRSTGYWPVFLVEYIFWCFLLGLGLVVFYRVMVGQRILAGTDSVPFQLLFCAVWIILALYFFAKCCLRQIKSIEVVGKQIVVTTFLEKKIILSRLTRARLMNSFNPMNAILFLEGAGWKQRVDFGNYFEENLALFTEIKKAFKVKVEMLWDDA